MLQKGMLAFALLGADWVLWLLVFLSIGCFALAIERTVYLVVSGTARAPLAAAVNTFLADRDRDQLSRRLSALPGVESRILAAGLEASTEGVDAAKEAMAGTAAAERLRMERGLAYLATVGSNAPFIGLFGTVLGIIRTLPNVADSAGNGMERVIIGISEALVATAIGLLVAIPAVILYNIFTRVVKGRLAVADSLASRVVSRLYTGNAHG